MQWGPGWGKGSEGAEEMWTPPSCFFFRAAVCGVVTPRDQPRRRTWGTGWRDLHTESRTGLPCSGLQFLLYQVYLHVLTQQALHKCPWSVEPLQEQACKPGAAAGRAAGGSGQWARGPRWRPQLTHFLPGLGCLGDPCPPWPGTHTAGPRVWAGPLPSPFLLQSGAPCWLILSWPHPSPTKRWFGVWHSPNPEGREVTADQASQRRTIPQT